MTISGAGVQPYTLSLREPWITARNSALRRSGYLLWIQTHDGRRGFGDAAAPPGQEPMHAAALERDLKRLTAAAVGRTEPLPIDSPIAGPVHPAARHAWVEAVASLQALAQGIPLHRWLAQRSSARVRPAVQVPVNATLAATSTPHTVAAARRARAQGYRCLKLKLNGSLAEVERVAAVRRAVGAKTSLRLDVNGAWTLPKARRLLKRLEPLGIEYVEQPLPARRRADLERLGRESSIPIAADESAHDPAPAADLIQRRAVDVVVLKPMALGGLDRALYLIDLARRHRVRVVITDSVESAIGRTGALHLAALLGSRAPACGLASGEWLREDIVPHAPRVVQGVLTAPQEPGLGLEGISMLAEAA